MEFRTKWNYRTIFILNIKDKCAGNIKSSNVFIICID